MSIAAKKKVYRYTPPTGKKLARMIYDRCKRNVERYARSHAGASIQFEPLVDAVATRGTMDMYLSGRTKQDEENYKKAYRTRHMGAYHAPSANAPLAIRRSQQEMLASAEANLARNLKREGVLPLDDDSFGWELDAEMFVVPPAPFDIKLNVYGDVPREILRCVESTYNEIIDEFHLEDE
jgi:hypothetical protein